MSPAGFHRFGPVPGGIHSIEADEAKPVVLVVDDESDIRLLIADSMHLFGYGVISASNADEAIRLIRSNRPDVITLDLAMPRRDGHSLIGQLGSDESTRTIPVVIVSAYARKLDRPPQIASVLSKPFDIADLIQAVEHAVSGRGNLQ